jgi:Rho GDP-dissociation inhibitor/dynein assembly factor 5
MLSYIVLILQAVMADTAAEGIEDLRINTPEDENNSNYKPPPEKTIEEILETDKEDESLRKYKEKLLGDAKMGTVIVGK